MLRFRPVPLIRCQVILSRGLRANCSVNLSLNVDRQRNCPLVVQRRLFSDYLSAAFSRAASSIGFQQSVDGPSAVGVGVDVDQTVVDELIQKNSSYLHPPSDIVASLNDLATTGLELNSIGEATFTSMGLGIQSCWYLPWYWMQSLLELSHVYIGLPWWSSIVALGILVRMTVFPFLVSLQRHFITFQVGSARAAVYREKIESLMSTPGVVDLNEMTDLGLTKADKEAFSSFRSSLYRLPLAQLGIVLPAISAMRAYNAMADLPVPTLMSGGLPWCPDLTVSDPFYVLPAICAAMLLCNIVVSRLGLTVHRNRKLRLTGKALGYGLVGSAVFAFISFQVGAIQLYFATTFAFAVLQGGFVRLPAVRRYFNIPSEEERNAANRSWTRAMAGNKSQKSQTTNSNEVFEAHRRQFREAAMSAVPNTMPIDLSQMMGRKIT